MDKGATAARRAIGLKVLLLELAADGSELLKIKHLDCICSGYNIDSAF
jgi:hypothetical protein